MEVDSRFIEALKLFNQRHFFESHEVMEDLWLETNDYYRDLYKGVIQSAAALHLLKRGPQSGAHELSKSSVRYLEKYKPRALGLNVEKLCGDMTACFGAFNGWNKKDKIIIPDAQIPKAEFSEDAL